MVHIDVDIVEYVIILNRKLTTEEFNKLQKDVNFVIGISCGQDLVVDTIDVNRDMLKQYMILDSSAKYPTYEDNLLYYNNRKDGLIERRLSDPTSDKLWNDLMNGIIEYCDKTEFKYELVTIEQVENDFNEKLRDYLSKTQFKFDRFGEEKLNSLLNHDIIKNNLKCHHYRTRKTTY